MKKVLLALLLMPALLTAQGRAKNVVLFLADAGGISTITAASLHATGTPRGLSIQKMPHIALSDTTTASQLVTDSAAGMTAIVTGQRTHNGVIAQGPDAVRGKSDGTPLKTILEYAEQRGLATGLVTNDSMTGATPASLYAHVNDRGQSAAIFQQAFAPRFGDGVDVMIGPGRAAITKALATAGVDIGTLSATAKRPIHAALSEVPADARRAIVLLDSSAFDLAGGRARRASHSLAQQEGLLPDGRGRHAHRQRSAGARSHGGARQGRGPACRRSWGATRWCCSRRITPSTSRSAAVSWASPSSRASRRRRRRPPRRSGATSGFPPCVWTTAHTGEPVMVAATGPGADRVRGYMQNTDLFRVMLSAFGWKEN